jgi:hypothetical protein
MTHEHGRQRHQGLDLHASFPGRSRSTRDEACHADIADLVNRAIRDRYAIAPCPTCQGPLVRSKARDVARCLRCGHLEGERRSRCWSCGAAVTVTMPADLALANANGRADVERMAPHATCQACGGQAETAPVVRRSWRKCEACRRPLSGRPPSRGRDLCPGCRQKRIRGQRREQNRRRRRVVAQGPNCPNVYGPVLTL